MYARLDNAGVAPCPSCQENRQAPRPVLVLLAALLVMPAVLGIVIQGRTVFAAAKETAAPAEIDVAIQRGVLSVKVRDAPLEDVLRAIAERTGLRFKLAGDLRRPITAWFALSVEQGIRQLVGDNGLIMMYKPASGQARQPMLTEIRVLGPPDGRVLTIEPAVKEGSSDRVYEG